MVISFQYPIVSNIACILPFKPIYAITDMLNVKEHGLRSMSIIRNMVRANIANRGKPFS